MENKRVGIIDNLSHITEFRDLKVLNCTADEFNQAVGGNSGNLAFVLGTNLVVDNPKTRVGWPWPVEQIKSRVDHIVVCCANQIGAHVELSNWANRLAQFDLPVTLIGLGAQTPNYEADIEIPDGTKQFLEVVSKLNAGSTSNIGVRGKYTQGVLQSIGVDSIVTGCPSMFISPDVSLGRTIAANSITEKKPRLAVAAGNPYHVATAPLERILIEIVEQSQGSYIVQHPTQLIALALSRFNEKEHAALQHLTTIYGGRFDVPGLIKWFRRNAYVFCDPLGWMDFLRHHDGVLGPRYHGIALGVQAGVPSLAVHMDNRTRELADTSCIKSISAEEFSLYSHEDIIKYISWSKAEGDAFDANRRKLANITYNFVKSNKLNPSDRLRDIALTSDEFKL